MQRPKAGTGGGWKVLTAQGVRDEMDQLAERIESVTGNLQTLSGAAMISELEQLRKGMETAAPDVIGAYYGTLRVREQFEQMIACNDWAKRHFWRVFGWQMAIMALLLLIGVTSAALVVMRVPFAVWLDSTLVICTWWGAVGASLSGLHALYMHRQRGTLSQNLDAWLWAKQLMGGVLGLLAAIALEVTAAASSGHGVTSTGLPALAAFLAGFSERRFLRYLQTRFGRPLESATPVAAQLRAPSSK